MRINSIEHRKAERALEELKQEILTLTREEVIRLTEFVLNLKKQRKNREYQQ